jgi:primosomal protein N''
LKNDTPIALADLTQMSEDERELLVNQIRERRLAPVRAYEELSLMQAAARKEQLEKQWTKALEMFQKDLARADKAMETLEKRGTKLRAINLEIEQI